ncbi:flagellar hook-basal body complex protein FliE [Sneathiella chinensis]|uniref:Flagellar hook-basal body complex protein FliE n=1 Tax=Sneathiella chinensis TaxID=349750 RepID=A0ABQ5U7N8_9PROT|nr:flagellar hook-basal body complex protein FliE [Sneathiella chinensis]GLQ07332.1 flagellar hook-basal body complex protein FliE 1 [Sneathiella chinensis]
MAETNLLAASQAYTRALSNALETKGNGATVGTDEVPAGPSFAELVQDAGKEAIGEGLQSEKVSLQSLTGDSGLADIVTAVSSAEVTLETVVSVRDRVIQAYQDIIKMPI